MVEPPLMIQCSRVQIQPPLAERDEQKQGFIGLNDFFSADLVTKVINKNTVL
jgi:hypothetical protein